VILYEMLAGAAPFNGENVTALMYQIVNFAPPAPSAVNAGVPEMLDYIVAKMLAKALEERYQDARELARDLRECERQLAAPPSAGPPSRPAVGLATGQQPKLVDTQAQTIVLAQTVNRTRQADRVPEEPVGDAPARGVAPTFDSIEATQRLAVLTGAATAPGALAVRETATQAIRSLPRPPAKGWRRRDWLLVAGAGVCGLLVARAIVRRGRQD
jgi:hypothetical protein